MPETSIALLWCSLRRIICTNELKGDTINTWNAIDYESGLVDAFIRNNYHHMRGQILQRVTCESNWSTICQQSLHWILLQLLHCSKHYLCGLMEYY